MNKLNLSQTGLKKILKTLIFLQLAAIGLSIPFYTSDLTLAGAFMGKFAIYVFWIIAVPGILMRFRLGGFFKDMQRVLGYNRRYLGIWMFLLALTHYLWTRAFGYIAFGFPDPTTFPLYMTFGMAAFTLLIPLVLTSNNWSVKKLGPYWKVLHYLTYPAMLLIILHTATQGNDLSIGGLEFGLDYTISYSLPSLAILFLQISSYLYHFSGKQTITQRIFELPIKQITQNTSKAINIDLGIPSELRDKFAFEAGQHINLHIPHKDQILRRSYSIASVSGLDYLRISVKRDGNGLVSNLINDTFQAGLKIKVSLPFGDFYKDTQLNGAKKVFLWAAGSGITPMMSILPHILNHFPDIKVKLVFANHDEHNIMFGSELDKIENQFSQRLQIVYVLSKPKADFESSNILTGRLDESKIDALLDTKESAVHYVCGPQGFIELISGSLKSSLIFPDKIHIEYFSKKNGNEALYATGQTVPTSGDYICLDCGYSEYLQAGQSFPVCPVCLAGQDDNQYEFWKAA